MTQLPQSVSGKTPPDPFVARVAAAILLKNSEFLPVLPSWSNPLSGVTLRKINISQATSLAEIFVPLATKEKLSLSYFLACVCIESRFDPKAQDGNFLGSNPSKAPEGFDIGVCQLKIKYLMDAKKLNVTDAYTFALDPAQALPYMAQDMNDLLNFAADLINQDQGDSSPIPQFQNMYMVATCAYNFGKSGMTTLFHNANELPDHGKKVLEFEKSFASILGLPSVFADITG